MLKIFSFVVIFINFSVFAHSNVSQEEIDRVRQIYASEKAESERLRSREQLFCGDSRNPLTPHQIARKTFRKVCEESEVDDIAILREKRDNIDQQIKSIEDHSSEYQEYLRYAQEFGESKHERDLRYILGSYLPGKELPKRLRLGAIQIDEAWRRWTATSEFNNWNELQDERETAHADFQKRCDQEKK